MDIVFERTGVEMITLGQPRFLLFLSTWFVGAIQRLARA